MKMEVLVNDPVLVQLIRERWRNQQQRNSWMGGCSSHAIYSNDSPQSNDLPNGWVNTNHYSWLEPVVGPLDEWILEFEGRRCSLFLCETPLGLMLPREQENVLKFESSEPSRPWWAWENEYWTQEGLRKRLIADLQKNWSQYDLDRWPWILGETR